MTAPEPIDAPRRATLCATLSRLAACALGAAVALGACDVAAHGPALRWFEAGEIVGLYALFGAVAALVALPIAALPLLLLRSWLGVGRAAALLLWIALAAVVLAALKIDLLGGAPALVALSLAALAAARSPGWFESTGRSRAGRRLALAALLALAVAPPIGRWLAAVPASNRAERAGGPPDVVLIVLDTQRADVLGAYGDRRGLSPRFDAFARESTLYENCFSAAPWTVPSHASLFTGLFPPTHGCSFEHHRWLDSRFETLAEALVARGFETAAFAANEYLFASNLLQGFSTREPLGARHAELRIRPLLELLGWPARCADHGAADAVEQVDRFLARDRDRERPLFLFVNLLEPHWRYLPALEQRLAQTRPEPGVFAATNVSRQFYGPLVMAGKAIGGPMEASIRALYAAAVQYQDEKLGELLAVLRRRLDLDHAVVAITADHGENLGDGGRFDHVFAVNDALLHVPLVIRGPQHFPPSVRIPGLCQLVDLPVTLYSLARQDGSGAFAENLAGRTLEPIKFEPRDVVLGFGDPYLGHLRAMEEFAGLNRDVLAFAAVQRSIRDANHNKLVRSSVTGYQLFDLAADPDETRDLSATDAALCAALRVRLEQELSKLPAYVGPPQRPPSDPEELFFDPRLRGLGY